MFGDIGRFLLRGISGRRYAKAFGPPPRFPIAVELRAGSTGGQCVCATHPREDCTPTPTASGSVYLSGMVWSHCICPLRWGANASVLGTQAHHVGFVPLRRNWAFPSLDSSRSFWISCWRSRASRIAPPLCAGNPRARRAVVRGACRARADRAMSSYL